MLRRALGLSVTALMVIAPAAMGQQYVAGSDGSGDPFFPQPGNGGYDFSHYSLAIDYSPEPVNMLTGTAVIKATATQNLRSFDLDLRDYYRVTGLTANGEQA